MNIFQKRHIKGKYLGIFLILIFMIFSGCRKNEMSSGVNLLTKGSYKNWYVKDIFSSSDLNSSIIRECEKDDFWRFAENGSWLYSPGTVQCTDVYPETVGKWAFVDNEKKISISDATNTEITRSGDYSVVELSSNKLVLEGRGQRITMTCGCK